MFFPFSNNRKRFSSSKDHSDLSIPVLPPSALYIHRRLTNLGIQVDIPENENTNWVALYLPEHKRIAAVFIHGDPILAKVKAKSFITRVMNRETSIHWIYPSTLYADCQAFIKKIAPFGFD